jgi:hypothetical protein
MFILCRSGFSLCKLFLCWVILEGPRFADPVDCLVGSYFSDLLGNLVLALTIFLNF